MHDYLRHITLNLTLGINYLFINCKKAVSDRETAFLMMGQTDAMTRICTKRTQVHSYRSDKQKPYQMG